MFEYVFILILLKDDYGQKTKLESEYSLMKTIQKVKKEAAKNAGLFIENTKDAKVINMMI